MATHRIGKRQLWILTHLYLNETGQLPADFEREDCQHYMYDPVLEDITPIPPNVYLTKFDVIRNMFPDLSGSNIWGRSGSQGYFRGSGRQDRQGREHLYEGDHPGYDWESRRLYNFALVTYHNAVKGLVAAGLITKYQDRRSGPNNDRLSLTDKGRDKIQLKFLTLSRDH